MTILPISSPVPAYRETLYSYLARLAAVWRTDTLGLAHDMGAPFKHLLNQDEEAFDALADWAKLCPDAMDELRSWTGVKAGNVRMKFRGELIVSRALRNPVVRGCPVCLREDASRAVGSASSIMVMRGDWQFREVTVCVRHAHPLVQLWTANALRDRFDIGARLREIESDVLSGVFDQPEQTPSGYDLWLDHRLDTGSDETWFRDKSLASVTTFCRLLGQTILKDQPNKNDRHASDAHSEGFEVGVKGAATIRATLDEIAERATGAQHGPAKTFGQLYIQLARDYLDEPDFDPFRDILRECILDHWPKAAGEIVLGQDVPERRLHSLATAATETGIGPKVLEYFLVEAGSLEIDDGRPYGRKLFDAKANAELLAEIPKLVGPNAMRRAMGATHQELTALADEGLLVPRTKVEEVKRPWRISDGLGLIAELSADAVPVDQRNESWETLLIARMRSRAALADLVKRILNRQLTSGLRGGVPGFHGIVVPKIEVDVFANSRRAERNEVRDVAPGTIAAADFGRSVGLRDGGVFLALIEAGHVPAQLAMNPLTGRQQYRMTPENISAFHQRFVTLTTLTVETGLHRNSLKSILASGKITSFSPGGQSYGSVYLREDVTALMRG